MIIYEATTTMTTVGGSITSTTLNMRGGILRYLLVRALTSNATMFNVRLIDDSLTTRVQYGYTQGELLDQEIRLPVSGPYQISITNASPDETFRIIASVEE